jgi:hypothetical protein
MSHIWARHQDILTDWPSVAMWLWLWLCESMCVHANIRNSHYMYNYYKSHERPATRCYMSVNKTAVVRWCIHGASLVYRYVCIPKFLITSINRNKKTLYNQKMPGYLGSGGWERKILLSLVTVGRPEPQCDLWRGGGIVFNDAVVTCDIRQLKINLKSFQLKYLHYKEFYLSGHIVVRFAESRRFGQICQFPAWLTIQPWNVGWLSTDYTAL